MAKASYSTKVSKVGEHTLQGYWVVSATSEFLCLKHDSVFIPFHLK